MSDVVEITKKGWIYLLYTSNAYKIGRTCDFIQRMKQYPKDTLILYCKFTTSEKLVEIEDDLKKIFRIQFTPRDDIGTEYFDGNSDSMISIIYLYFKENVGDENKNHKKFVQEIKKKKTKSAQKKSNTDKDIILYFIEKYCIATNDNSDMTRTKEVYIEFKKSTMFNGCDQAWFSLNMSKYGNFQSKQCKKRNENRDVLFIKGLKLKNSLSSSEIQS